MYKSDFNGNESDDDDKDVEIPKVKGHENCVQWRDAFTASLSATVGSRGISLDYIVDPTTPTVTRATDAFAEHATIALDDDIIYHSSNPFCVSIPI